MKRKNNGFSLITAIFILVIVASLAVFMVTIGSIQQQTSVLSILSTRALFAADSGMQWAVRTVLTDGNCSAFPAGYTLSGGATGGYQISASCAATPHTEAPGPPYNVYRLSVTASLGNLGAADYVSRTVVAKVTNAP